MMHQDLFQANSETKSQPLAAKMRPTNLLTFVGQKHILAPGMPLYEAIQQGKPHSMILWGPPGVGKTTIAQIIAQSSNSQFLSLSAVMSGVKEIRDAIKQAQLSSQSTLLFIDEVHRFNKLLLLVQLLKTRLLNLIMLCYRELGSINLNR
jgi:putative ATPase